MLHLLHCTGDISECLKTANVSLKANGTQMKDAGCRKEPFKFPAVNSGFVNELQPAGTLEEKPS